VSLVVIFVLSIDTACNLLLSDSQHDVFLHNNLDVMVVVEDGASVRPEDWPLLAPGETRRVGWLTASLLERPEEAVRRVAASDAIGRVVFCRRYSYRALEALTWRIEISAGDLECT
jgi:hypothetical protein